MCKSILENVKHGLKFLYHTNNFLDFRTRKLLRISLLQSGFNYAHIDYYKGLIKNLEQSYKLPKIRLHDLYIDIWMPSLGIQWFHDGKISDCQQWMECLNLSIVCGIRNTTPAYVCSYDRVTDVHNHNTRNRCLLFHHTYRVKVRKVSFMCTCVVQQCETSYP